MSKKTSVRKKVSALTAAVSFVSVLIVGIITLSSLFVLRSNIIAVGGQLGDMAAREGMNTLEEIMINRMEILAINRAAMSDALLLQVERAAEIIAFRATEIMQNSGRYSANPVPPPDPANAGVLTAQFIRAETGVDLAAIRSESEILGNIKDLLFDIALNFNTQTFITSELGYTIDVDKDSGVKPDFLDQRGRPWYVLARDNNAVSWTDFYSDVYGRGGTVTCAAPFYGANGLIAGVVGIDLFFEGLVEIVESTMAGETGYAFLLDQNDDVIIYNKDSPVIETAAAVVVNGQNGTGWLTIDGSQLFVAYAPMKELPWTFAIVLYVSDYASMAFEGRDNIIRMRDNANDRINNIIIIVVILLIAVFAVITLPIALVSRKFANTLTKPITVLSEGVRLIADGNLDYNIDLRTGDEIDDLGESVNKMAVGLKEYIFNLQKVTAEKERISAELNVAAKIQTHMLPCIFPAFPDRAEFDIYASMQPANEVGGDFYDFFMIDNNTLAVVMADVSDKGIPAALFMVITKTLIKNNAQYGNSPEEVFEIVNRQICENNKESMFVTAFMGYLDIPSGRFIYVNAGHNPPLIKRGNADFELLSVKPGFVLGGLKNMVYKQHETTLGKGDMLYLYTDGVTEAANHEGELFTEKRLLSSVNKNKNSNLTDFLNGIKTEIDLFTGAAEQSDDITMLILKIKR